MLAYQVDDASGGLLVTNEKKTLAGVGSPGNVVLGNFDVLLSPLVGSEKVRLDGLGAAEEEKCLASDEVPVIVSTY
jgi:hypothetical protein